MKVSVARVAVGMIWDHPHDGTFKILEKEYMGARTYRLTAQSIQHPVNTQTGEPIHDIYELNSNIKLTILPPTRTVRENVESQS